MTPSSSFAKPHQAEPKHGRTKLSTLNEETIRAKTKKGSTPLHLAAKNGQFDKIPSHLLNIDLFLVKDNSGYTPVHVAAKFGNLNKIPAPFLNEVLLTQKVGDGSYYTASGYRAQTETALHIAVRCGFANHIPYEYLKPKFLTIEATGYRWTLLHGLASAGRLDLIPGEYANSEMWNLRDHLGRTPREIAAGAAQRSAYISAVRREPATQKQKDKLRFFGYEIREGMTKSEASDAIDECVRKFPEVDRAYYNRPANEEQIAKLKSLLKADGEEPEDYADRPLTYGQAKELLQEIELETRRRDEEEFIREAEKELRRNNTSSKEWFERWDNASVIEAKAKEKLAQEGLVNVCPVVARVNGKVIINLEAPTNHELTKAAKILGIKKSDCI